MSVSVTPGVSEGQEISLSIHCPEVTIYKSFFLKGIAAVL
jgi:hypothetical protein